MIFVLWKMHKGSCIDVERLTIIIKEISLDYSVDQNGIGRYKFLRVENHRTV